MLQLYNPPIGFFRISSGDLFEVLFPLTSNVMQAPACQNDKATDKTRYKRIGRDTKGFMKKTLKDYHP